MNIVADQNIPLVKEFFADFGRIKCLPGRDIIADDLVDTDILLVRSVTQVNKTLMENSPVKFVGSCTIGIDHIDTDYLAGRNIHWANAPGCNANAVVQYVLSAMAHVESEWLQKTVGIIGCGNIGGRLYNRLKKIGIKCLCYDPFLNNSDNQDLVTFEEVLQADIITCHTPLTKAGPFPTYHLLSKEALAQLRQGVLLINSGRGPVIDNQSLLEELNRRSLNVVLDVWENEPVVNRPLLEKITLGTPHIAGYSIEGRERGTFMVYQALCRYLNVSPKSDAGNVLTNDQLENKFNKNSECLTDNTELEIEQQFNQLLLSCYNIKNDHESLCQVENFDRLRKDYVSRREYSHFLLPEEYKHSQISKWFEIVKGSDHS